MFGIGRCHLHLTVFSPRVLPIFSPTGFFLPKTDFLSNSLYHRAFRDFWPPRAKKCWFFKGFQALTSSVIFRRFPSKSVKRLRLEIMGCIPPPGVRMGALPPWFTTLPKSSWRVKRGAKNLGDGQSHWNSMGFDRLRPFSTVLDNQGCSCNNRGKTVFYLISSLNLLSEQRSQQIPTWFRFDHWWSR